MLDFISNFFRNLHDSSSAPQTALPPISQANSQHSGSQNRLHSSRYLQKSMLTLHDLLHIADQLQTLMLYVYDLLKQNRLHNELGFIQAELENIEKQFFQLSSSAVFYEQDTHARQDDFISENLAANLNTIRNSLDSCDVVIREFNFGPDRQISACLLFIDGLTNKNALTNGILRPLMFDTCLLNKQNLTKSALLENIQRNLLSTSDVKKIIHFSELQINLLSGETILLINDLPEALAINAAEWETRSIDKPEMENVIRGPREGFSEDLQINTSLLRRKIHNPNFRLETMIIGEQTQTKVCMAYLKNITNPQLVNEVNRRLQRIDIDAVLDSGYIEAFIEDAPYSIFATIANSEKPDVVAAKILEGRIALLVDGSPIALTMPMLFTESFQSPEDYYVRPYYASLLRMIRFLAFLLSIFSPAVYVALTTFHQELIPSQLLFTLAAGGERVPFSGTLEAFIMIVIFEVLREAGIRLPHPVGSAVSIVGALVIGQTAVSAGLISPIMVIVIGLTAIASFVNQPVTDSSLVLRFFLLLAAGLIGGFGILLVSLAVLLHLASLRSFGVPFLYPLAPFSLTALRDVFIRAPLWTLSVRPDIFRPSNRVRQSPSSMPSSVKDKHKLPNR